MPIVISATEPETNESVAAFLEDADGNPTLQAEVLRRFLDEVDFNDVFEALAADAEGKTLINVSEAYAKFDAELDCYVECEKDDEGAEKVTVESIDPEALAEVVDLDDLTGMFDYYMTEEHDASTLQGKLEASTLGYSDSEEVDEARKGPFKKGDFRRMRKQAGGALRVGRMLYAMMGKEAIKRVPAGTGYVSGDYKRDKGYGPGTAAGQRRYKLMVSTKKAKFAKTARKAAQKKVKLRGKEVGGAVKAAAKKAMAKKNMAAAVKAVKAKQASGKKKLASGVEAPGANLTESSMPQTRNNPNIPVIHESTQSQVGLLGRMGVGKKQ